MVRRSLLHFFPITHKDMKIFILGQQHGPQRLALGIKIWIFILDEMKTKLTHSKIAFKEAYNVGENGIFFFWAERKK